MCERPDTEQLTRTGGRAIAYLKEAGVEPASDTEKPNLLVLLRSTPLPYTGEDDNDG